MSKSETTSGSQSAAGRPQPHRRQSMAELLDAAAFDDEQSSSRSAIMPTAETAAAGTAMERAVALWLCHATSTSQVMGRRILAFLSGLTFSWLYTQCLQPLPQQ